MESWNFDFYKEIDLPGCTGNGDGPECGGGGSLLNGGRGWGSILQEASLWGDFDGSWLLDLEEGGVRMTSGPDETNSVLLGFFIRLNEPNVELLLKTNQGAHEELIFHLWTAACFWRCFWSNSSSPAPFQVALLGDFELKQCCWTRRRSLLGDLIGWQTWLWSGPASWNCDGGEKVKHEPVDPSPCRQARRCATGQCVRVADDFDHEIISVDVIVTSLIAP